MGQEKNILIAGAGLVGSLLGIYLSQKGHRVKIHERREDMRKAEISAGRSINLALSDRGWKALEGAGVAGEVRKVAIPMHGRMIHHQNGDISFQPYGKESQAIYSVSRGGLNQLMMTEAEKYGVEIEFNSKIERADPDQTTFYFENGKKEMADIVFGADGAFSMVRLSMQLTDRFDYSQQYLQHAYKELSIPPGENEKWQIEKNALHIWPRKSFMLIALPNMDGSFTCTLFAPFEGENSFEQIRDEKSLLLFFEKNFSDAVSLMPTLVEDFFGNPTSSLVTVKCSPWVINKTALIGDAAHAIVPFFGQGMNAGFEDCTILNEIINECNVGNWDHILNEFQLSRKSNGDAIADLAIQNFIEMRDLVADPKFLLRKKLEKEMHARIPAEFIPLYTMVTFSHLPYSQALEEGKKQDRFFKELFEESELSEIPSDKEINLLIEKWRSIK